MRAHFTLIHVTIASKGISETLRLSPTYLEAEADGAHGGAHGGKWSSSKGPEVKDKNRRGPWTGVSGQSLHFWDGLPWRRQRGSRSTHMHSTCWQALAG